MSTTDKPKLTKLLKPIFYYSRGDRELELTNFTGTLADGGTFEWKTCFFKPGLAFSGCCNAQKNNCGAFIWVFIIRTVLFSVACAYFSDDFMGKITRKEPFMFHPNHVIFFFLMYYYVVTLIGYGVYSVPQIVNEAKDGAMPRILRMAWFSYTMALPASLVSLVAYCTLDNTNKTAQASYICNFCFWFVDLVVGRMILYPGHWLHYMVFWFLYGIVFMWYLFTFNPGDASILIVCALKVGVFGQVCYVLTSTLTYIRSNWLDVWPIMYGPSPDMYPIDGGSKEADLGTDEEKKIVALA